MEGYFEGRRGLRQGIPYLLFVICLEYFNRMMKRMTSHSGFHFHPKCKRIGLTYMAFADNLMLFCRGDRSSVTCLKEVLAQFLTTSRLILSLHKSRVFMAGVSEEDQLRITKILGFLRGNFHVWYLGIPLHCRNLKVGDFNTLINKITAKIRGWSSRHISYAGRVDLIKSVLYAIQNFWARVFFFFFI